MSQGYENKQKIGLFLGPALFAFILWFYEPTGLGDDGRAVLASSLWIAVWWITEAMPISITSLLPLILFPLSGGTDMNSAAAPFANKIIFLFIGGFMLALGIEKWNLHKRIALRILSSIGSSEQRVILGFMLATFLLSMWISNTATTMMMVPIALAVCQRLFGSKRESGYNLHEVALLLSIAYAASIGGMATLIGTPTNLIFAAMIGDLFGTEIGFMQWMALALPFAISLVFLCWYFLTRVLFSFTMQDRPTETGLEAEELPRISREEKVVAAVFGIVALLWISRSWLQQAFVPALNDSIIALAGGIVLFLWPSVNDEKGRILNWTDIQRLPWGIVLLFGGGLSLASAFSSSGLSTWIGEGLQVFSGTPLLVVLLFTALLVNFLTEFTMNISTASMILPVLAQLSLSLGFHPLVLMVAATLAASCAFMLPIATAPNAIVFATERIGMHHMLRAGIALNLVSVLLIGLLCYFFLGWFWDIDLFGPLPPFDQLSAGGIP